MTIPHDLGSNAAERLVGDHAAALCAYVASLGCPSELVEDVVQDTFVIVLDQGFDQRSERETRAYLRTVARNRFLRTHRDRPRGQRIDLDEVDAIWARFEGDDDGQRYLTALERCLALLPDRNRELLQLRYGHALNREAIAERTQLSLGGVKSVLQRCKKELRTCIERRLAE